MGTITVPKIDITEFDTEPEMPAVSGGGNQHTCDRCGRRVPTQTVETTQGKKQTVQLCAECIKDVIRPNTNYQVKK